MSHKQYSKLEKSLAIKPGTFIKKLNRMHDLIIDSKEIALLETQEEFPKVKIFQRINQVIENRIKNLYRQKVIG